MNLTDKLPLSIKTDRFLIRRYRESDDKYLYDAARASIREVFEFLPWCHPDYTQGEARNWLENVEPGWTDASAYNFAIFDHSETVFHGGCGINRIDEHPIGNLGYWINTSSAGKGIATEATRALARFGLRDLGLQRIEIVMSVRNIGSKRVAERAGARFEGTLRNRLMLHGKPHDAHMYSLTPADLKL